MSPHKKIKVEPSEKKPTDDPSGRVTTRSGHSYSRKRVRNPKWLRKIRMGPPNKITDSTEEEEKRDAAAGQISTVAKTPSTVSVAEGPSSASDPEPEWKRMRILVPRQPGEADNAPAAGSGNVGSGVPPVEIDPTLARYLKLVEGKDPPQY